MEKDKEDKTAEGDKEVAMDDGAKDSVDGEKKPEEAPQKSDDKKESRSRSRSASRSRSRSKSRSRSRSKSRGKDKSRSRSRGKNSKSRSRSRGKNSNSDKKRKQSRSRSRSKSNSRSRSRSRGRNSRKASRSASRSRSRRRDRSRGSRSRSRSRDRKNSAPSEKEEKEWQDQDVHYGRKVYVGNLDYRTDQAYLRDKFERYGRVIDVFVPCDAMRRPRGFAFVTFEDDRDAKAAVDRMNGREVDGRTIQCNIARARPPRGAGGSNYSRGSDRGRDRGGYGGDRDRGYGRGRDRERSRTKLYVGNLPMDCKQEEVEDLFYKFGKIRYLEVKQVARPPGFAFLEFEDERDAEDAVRKLNGSKFDKEYLRVEFANR